MTRTQGISWSGGEQNHLFLNAGDGAFCDVSAVSHADFKDDGRAVVPLDWDGDGRLDLLLRSRTAPRVRLMLNQAPAGNWIGVRLQGVSGNRDAIGARVEVKAGDLVLRRTLQAGDGFLAQGSKTLHFGLGEAARVDEIRVHWPQGEVEIWRDLPADQLVHLTEGQAAPTEWELAAATHLHEGEATPVKREGQPVVRVPLIEKIPLHGLPIPSADNPQRTVADLAGRPVLLNLWGVNCVNCLKEFGAFQRRAKQLQGRGLQIVPLNTDGPELQARAADMLARFELDQHAGRVSDVQLQALEAVLYEVLGTSTGTPLPTSLLLDARGQLCVVYQGKVKVADLLRDTALVSAMDPRNPSAAELHFGTRLMKRHRNWHFLAKAFASYGLQSLASEYQARAQAVGGR
jgi:peroxiredoxin